MRVTTPRMCICNVGANGQEYSYRDETERREPGDVMAWE
jgi:hypothetical protein